MNNNSIDNTYKQYINLADAGKNAQAIFASDDFFAPKERLLSNAEPLWQEGVYDEHGKWMDGWESRRKREHGHDYCIVQLFTAGIIHAVDIDTRYFTGNYPPLASLDACHQHEPADNDSQWIEILAQNVINGNSHNIFDITNRDVFNHVRLNIFPDGGVARLRIYGEPA